MLRAISATCLGKYRKLAQGFCKNDGTADRLIDRAGFRDHGNGDAGISAFMNALGHAAAFAAKQQEVTGSEGKIRMGCFCFCGKQHDAPVWGFRHGGKGGEIIVACHCSQGGVIHAGTPQRLVVMAKTRGIDDVQLRAETGGESNQRTGISGNIWLIEGEGGFFVRHACLIWQTASVVRIRYWPAVVLARLFCGLAMPLPQAPDITLSVRPAITMHRGYWKTRRTTI